ncbi:hypothetical protein [Roseospira navarrensis]|uniref:hypothetical protein n=1 Tax=Roseospira navarrensis TaxID=140058 RepID=UPI0014789DD5|nr:hypothetical protein [Roseospira navarrensis]
MDSPTSSLDELDQFLASLDRRIARLGDSGRILHDENGGPPRFMDYARTRNLTSECMAFSIVIARRIEGLPDPDRARRQATFDRLTIRMWGTLLDCSLTFLNAMAQEPNLPLGSREVFLREIKTLHDAHGTLAQDRFADLMPGDLMSRHRQAHKILNEIIDRAPRLLDLG